MLWGEPEVFMHTRSFERKSICTTAVLFDFGYRTGETTAAQR